MTESFDEELSEDFSGFHWKHSILTCSQKNDWPNLKRFSVESVHAIIYRKSINIQMDEKADLIKRTLRIPHFIYLMIIKMMIRGKGRLIKSSSNPKKLRYLCKDNGCLIYLVQCFHYIVANAVDRKRINLAQPYANRSRSVILKRNVT